MKVEEGSKIKFLLQFITVALLFCSLGINLWLKKEIDHVTVSFIKINLIFNEVIF